MFQQSGEERLFQQSGEERLFQQSGEEKLFQQSGEELILEQFGKGWELKLWKGSTQHDTQTKSTEIWTEYAIMKHRVDVAIDI